MTELPTGVPNLDLILGGGLPTGSVVLLTGPPGTGKTILAQQICFANATPERRAVFYTTLSESHSKLVRHLAEFQFFDQAALGARIDYVHLGDMVREAARDGLGPMADEVVRTALEERPALLVIDSVKMLHDVVDPTVLRTALYDLTSRIGHTDTVLLMIAEHRAEDGATGTEFALADGIIQLAYAPRVPIDRRWLRVVKMRGRRHLEGEHTFHITPAGVRVFPRTETVHPRAHTPVADRLPTGVPGLDELMGGGIPAGDATAVVGPSGIGKSTLALGFVGAGLRRGEGCLYVSFQETPADILERARTFGGDLDEAHRDGRLQIEHVPTLELDLDALTERIRAALDAGPVRRVVIESLEDLIYAACEAARFPAYKRALIDTIRAAGASLLITSESTTISAARPWEALTFLFHNVLLLRYIEFNTQVGRALNVTKMRHSHHAMGLHELRIGDGGVAIGRQLDDVTGVLGWSQLRQQSGTAG